MTVHYDDPLQTKLEQRYYMNTFGAIASLFFTLDNSRRYKQAKKVRCMKFTPGPLIFHSFDLGGCGNQ